METTKLTLDIPSDLTLTLNESEEDLKKHIKLLLAIMLYQEQKLTIGKAAQLACLSRYEFESALSKHKIPISNLTFEDIQNDIGKLKGS